MSKIRIASDGLRARENGPWAEDKLSFLDRFVPPGLSIAKGKRDRVYVDLFAGPGKNVVPETGREIDGSTIRALQLRGQGHSGAPFTEAHAVNLVELDNDALSQRIAALYRERKGLVPRPKVHLHNGDANVLVPTIMQSIHPRAYVFVIADIEAPSQWPWASVEALKARHHESVDLFMLFPLGMGINRLVAIANAEHTKRNGDKLDAFYGTDLWRSICSRRITESQSPEVRRQMTDLYLSRLNELWPHVGVVGDILKNRGQRLYKMLFATKDDAAQRVAAYVRRGGPGDAQGSLF